MPRKAKRILMYSHDTFGLGHLRRCRTIAHHLVENDPSVSILILTGSPIIGSFSFRPHVDFVRIPGVIKLHHGDYSSLSLPMDFEDVLSMRASIIQHTAESFDPDVMIVDKEPLGLRGEMLETLKMLKTRGCELILGLRDVMDDPQKLRSEWDRKNVTWVLRDLYDQIWAYGIRDIWDPLNDTGLGCDIREKVQFTGYLRREVPRVERPEVLSPDYKSDPYVLVTTGGGGDGEEVVDWVISAYEQDPSIEQSAIIVFGPFMAQAKRAEFSKRIDQLERVRSLTFEAQMETLFNNAVGIISMGGYNSFCEALSFDKPTLIIPRTEPRLEQYIRASQAQNLGLIKMLDDRLGRDPAVMAQVLKEIAQCPKPSDAGLPDILTGLENIQGLIGDIFRQQETTIKIANG